MWSCKFMWIKSHEALLVGALQGNQLVTIDGNRHCDSRDIMVGGIWRKTHVAKREGNLLR